MNIKSVRVLAPKFSWRHVNFRGGSYCVQFDKSGAVVGVERLGIKCRPGSVSFARSLDLNGPTSRQVIAIAKGLAS